MSARVAALLVATALALTAPTALPATASAETVSLPGDAATGTSANSLIYQVACPAAGDCVGVGGYTDSSGHHQALIESESDGAWSSQEIPGSSLPGAASSLSPPPVPWLTSVACTAVADCVAADAYADANDDEQGLIDVESAGDWTPIEAPLTGVAPVFSNPGVEVADMACPALDACVGIGTYVSGSNNYEQGLIETQSADGWSAAEMPWPATEAASGNPDFYDISCAGVGNCAAVGYYTDTGDDQQGLLESDSGGTWNATELDLSQLGASAGEPAAANPEASVDDVSCPAAGDCTAVGTYEDAAGAYVPFAVNEVGGQWQAASALALPGDASTTPAGSGDPIQNDLYLNGVACPSVGDCTAVGSYDEGAGNDVEAFTVTESGGSWVAGAALALPGDGAAEPPADPEAALYSITCQAAGECLAAGSYVDAAGDNVVLVARQSDGAWTSAAADLSSAYDPTLANLYWASVACAPGGYCAAGGYLADAASGLEDAFMLDAPAAPGETAASRSGTQATVTWAAPADNGGLPVSGYTVTANDISHTSVTSPTATVAATANSATLSGLSAGDSYSFTVTAQSLLGSGVPATSATVAGGASSSNQPSGDNGARARPSHAQIAASLRALLRSASGGAALRALRNGRAYTLHYRALEAGRVRLRWYQGETGGHARRARVVLVASGTASAARATQTRTLRVRLTSAGRRLLDARPRRRLRLTATGTFAGGGGASVAVSVGIVIKS